MDILLRFVCLYQPRLGVGKADRFTAACRHDHVNTQNWHSSRKPTSTTTRAASDPEKTQEVRNWAAFPRDRPLASARPAASQMQSTLLPVAGARLQPRRQGTRTLTRSSVVFPFLPWWHAGSYACRQNKPNRRTEDRLRLTWTWHAGSYACRQNKPNRRTEDRLPLTWTCFIGHCPAVSAGVRPMYPTHSSLFKSIRRRKHSEDCACQVLLSFSSPRCCVGSCMQTK